MNKINNALSSIITSEFDFSKDMIVFCHLRWEFVKQRPQHIISRIAKNREVLFIEEPIGFDNSNYGTANVFKAADNITVVQPRISHHNYFEELSEIVNKYKDELEFNKPVLWFYSGAFSGVIDNIEHSLVVYDCMDELSAFKGASPELISHEKYLLSRANIVFTGGISLAESKSKHHTNVHCFPSSVEREHFKKALIKSTLIPEDIASIKKPVVGYYGVIDERIDLDLISEVSTKMPNISFVIIGPVVKIDEKDLPRNENLYYLGSKPYDELPNYLKAIDVAMMPFALNESTRFISPTKTLEYMAAQKPIVSTPIIDVVRSYSNHLAIAKNSLSFMNSIWLYLNETKKQRDRRLKLYNSALNKTSWDSTVDEMKKIIAKSLVSKKFSSKVNLKQELSWE